LLHNFVQDHGTNVVVVTRESFCGRVRAMSGSAPLMIVVNGEARSVAPGTSIAALIGELGFGDRRVAVERNREVIPRAQHATTILGDGDRLELVTFVGGG
jgi:sulfur carrier protein